MKIVDGAGSGVHAKVNEDQRLLTSAVSSDQAVLANTEGGAFWASTPILSLAAATETAFAYFKNSDTQNSLVIDLVKICSDLGSTNNDKPVTFRFYLDGSAPSANNTSKDAQSASTQASGRPSVDFEHWDEVGSGLTQASAGDLLIESIHLQSPSESNIPSRFILGPSKAVTFSLECTEACEASLIIFAHI